MTAAKLLNSAVDAWKRNSLARDDITCVVLYLWFVISLLIFLLYKVNIPMTFPIHLAYGEFLMDIYLDQDMV